MKGMFKRALAGVAAAALAATGLALGAGAANAVEADENGVVTADATFTFTGSTASKSLTAYKIADYVQYGSEPDFVYGVRTNADNKTVVEKAMTAATTNPQYNSATDGDAMAWAAQNGALDQSASSPWSEGTTRAFARALAAKTGDLKNGTGIDLNVDTTVNLDAGVYLFVDATDNDYANNANDPIAMIAYSGTVTENNELIEPTKGAEVVLKNYVTSVTKTVNDAEATTASTGQDVAYTITGQMPVTTGDAATDDKSDYKFVDTPGAGQDINFGSITVTVDGKVLEAGTDYVRPTELAEGSFTIDLTDWMKKQTPSAERKPIVVTYNATITAMEGSVNNTVAVYDNEAKAEDTTTVTLGGFSFTKTDAEGNHVGEGDATFEIAGKGDTFTPTTATASTNAQGEVTFKGLADGTYTVTETENSEVYADYMAQFEVTIKNGVATAMKGTDIYGLAGDATDNAAATYTVKNVKNITQLPLTGAAGTALFTVLGLLIAGAGALAYMKSRNVKHALRG